MVIVYKIDQSMLLETTSTLPLWVKGGAAREEVKKTVARARRGGGKKEETSWLDLKKCSCTLKWLNTNMHFSS